MGKDKSLINKARKGTGRTVHTIERELKYVSVNFDGSILDANNNLKEDYTNDASIFFFVANSYRHSFHIIGEKIEQYFNSGAKDKYIEHLILPYYFNFRHYLELELKALITCLTDQYPQLTHDLEKLFRIFKEEVFKINKESEVDKDSVKTINNIIVDLEKIISNYIDCEPSEEYYRYIFTKSNGSNNRKFIIENTLISLVFTKQKADFSKIVKMFDQICQILRELGVYVYYTL